MLCRERKESKSNSRSSNLFFFDLDLDKEGRSKRTPRACPPSQLSFPIAVLVK